MGQNSKTVYDYADGTTYVIYQLEDGKCIERRIYDSTGNEVALLIAERKGFEIKVIMAAKDNSKTWKVCLAGIDSVQTNGIVERSERGVCITPPTDTANIEIHL